jgi:ribosomal protein S18 acetylase RimI-like enzyme
LASEGLGLATRLIGELEARALQRGVRRMRIGVGIDNPRARRLYEHLGYAPIGESEASWTAEAEDGSPFLHTAKLIEMLKEM